MKNQNSFKLVFCFIFNSSLHCVFCSFSLYVWRHPKEVATEVFTKKKILKIFAKLTGKYLFWSRSEILLRKRIWYTYFPVIFQKHLFYRIFPGACSIAITWITNKIFLLLSYVMCIYWSFGSFCICYCFTNQVITIMPIIVTLTKFVL